MANNTPEFWDIDGTSLHQYGWSVTTIGGSRLNLPPRRGENQVLAYTPGATWRPKQADQRTISLSFFLTGMDPATGNYSYDEIRRWNDSWDALRRLVWRVEGRQFDLTRRQRLTINGTEQLLTTTGKAEMTGTMEPTMTGRTRADFVMDLTMADPYFYGDAIEATIGVGQQVTVNNPGFDAASHKNVYLYLYGPFTAARVTNVTSDPDNYVLYAGTVAAGHFVILDVANYFAYTDGGTNVTGNVTFAGSRRWMSLLPGNNLLTLGVNGSYTSATKAKVSFRPPYV